MARAYRVGERVSIDLVVRNTTNRPLQFKYLGGWWWASPSLAVTREGKKQEVRQSILLGAVPILTKQLQPGKSVELPHVGLWIGRAAEGHGAEPTLVAPAPGKYLVELGSPLSHDLEPTARVDASVEFEVVAE